jgi:cation transport protein ChaC
MPSGVYDPKWLACRTPHGGVRGLAFTLSRRSPAIPAGCPRANCSKSSAAPWRATAARWRYLVETERSLRTCGIRDRDVERLDRHWRAGTR